MTDLAQLDATAQAELVREGDASPLELIDAAINRIEKLNGELNAVIHPLFDQARDRARGDLPDGPFRGVPIVFKDLFAAVKGDPYHEGIRAAKAAGYRADHTDVLAQRFLDAGFICVGRTNTPEIGLVPTTEPLAYGASHNPWDTTRTTGGSSGGSAAAVASGMVPVGHANDGGGSIRIPASCCGLVGLKPSRGRGTLLPESNIIENLLVAELCVSRSVRDTAAVLDAVQGPAVGDTVHAPPPARPYADELDADPGRLRVKLITQNATGDSDIHPDCIEAAHAAARLLESLGHTVEETTWPTHIGDPRVVGLFLNLWAGNTTYVLRTWEAKLGRALTSDDVEPLTWTLAEIGRDVDAATYIQSQHAMLDLGRAFQEWFASGFDVLLTPTLGEPPVPLGTFDGGDEPILGFIRAAQFVPYTPLANISGDPAISLPLHWNNDGLPIGVQLQAPFGREDVLVRVAAQLERAQPWADRRPPVHA